MPFLTSRWLSLKITRKFGVVLFFMILIGMAETGITLTSLNIVVNASSAAQTSLDTQRMTLEMHRDWEVMLNYQNRFFIHYQEIGYQNAKELYAIPAGEKLSAMIRRGAGLRRMTSAPGASENLQDHDALLQRYLADVNAYAAGLEDAVQLAAETDTASQQHIPEKLAELDALSKAIEPGFTYLILMAQKEVAIAQEQIKSTQQSVSLYLALANLFGFALIALVLYFFNKNISASVARLTEATARMQAGALDERVTIKSADEFARIGAAFNDMAASIQGRTEALRESEARYRELVTAAPYFVFVVQEDRFVYANPACLNALNYTLETLVLMDILAIVNPEDRPLFEGWMQAAGQESGEKSVEIRVVDKDGQTLFLDLVAVLITYDHKPALLGIGQDITQRKIMEKAVIETEKLAGIGTLAAGMAHEINSPLQVITGYTDSISREIKTGALLQTEKLDRKIASIDRSAWRIAAIVQSLLTYARPSADRNDHHSLNNIIEDTLLLIEHQLHSWSNITIEKELAADLPPLKCDSNRITQVLINLLTNAADAMPDGGQITIRTQADADNKHIILQISDSGPGIPESMKDKIFDPFFTTKDIGKGTGLGLSVVRGIVTAHSGEISVENAPNKGAIFTIYLPEEAPRRLTALDDEKGGRY